MKTIKNGFGFDYILVVPDDFRGNKKYPVIVHYHGHGWVKRMATDMLENYGVLNNLERFSNEKDFVAVLPICNEESWFDCFSELKTFTRQMKNAAHVDENRFYLSGISMGGCAAWQMLCTLNELFAAGIVCCGISMYWDARRRLKAPVWAFHGLKDEIIYHEETKKIAKVINERGGEVKTTFYENVAHRCWDFAYSDEKTYDWLLSKVKD